MESNNIQNFVFNLKALNDQILIEGMQLLIKLFGNIISNPNEDKFRMIKMTNQTLLTKLFVLSGLTQLLEALGFILIEESYGYLESDLSNISMALSLLYQKIALVQQQQLTEEEKMKQFEIQVNHITNQGAWQTILYSSGDRQLFSQIIVDDLPKTKGFIRSHVNLQKKDANHLKNNKKQIIFSKDKLIIKLNNKEYNRLKNSQLNKANMIELKNQNKLLQILNLNCHAINLVLIAKHSRMLVLI